MKQVTCRAVQGQTYKVPVEELTFRPAIYGVIVQDSKVLLSKQWDGYDFPGGGIELGEGLKQALIREVKEETGLEVRMGEILHADHSFFKNPFGESFFHSIHLWYRCQVTGGELSIDNLAEVEKQYVGQPEWIEVKKLDQIKLYGAAGAAEAIQQKLLQ